MPASSPTPVPMLAVGSPSFVPSGGVVGVPRGRHAHSRPLSGDGASSSRPFVGSPSMGFPVGEQAYAGRPSQPNVGVIRPRPLPLHRLFEQHQNSGLNGKHPRGFDNFSSGLWKGPPGPSSTALRPECLPEPLRSLFEGSARSAPERSTLQKLFENARSPPVKSPGRATTTANRFESDNAIDRRAPVTGTALANDLLHGMKPRNSKPRNHVGGGIQWLFDAVAATGATEARLQVNDTSAKKASPRTMQVEVPLSMDYSENPWDFNRREDNIDDELLFRREELQRRRNPRYLARTKRLHDLHLVIPISIPYGKITVEDPLGPNFYSFPEEQHGAHILFGKGVSDLSIPKSTLTGKPAEEAKKSDISPVCDVWASFLHVRLGTIYNLTTSQMQTVTELFRTSFDSDLCKFYVPIAMDCRGVHPSSDELISQRAARSIQLIRESKDGRKVAAERYETHAVPSSENDIKRLRMLRRHLLQFASHLINDLGFDTSRAFQQDDPIKLLTPGWDHPKPCIELHDNCRTSTLLRGSLKIVVREWSPLSDPQVFKKVWAGQMASPGGTSTSSLATEVFSKLLHHKTIPSARILLGEIRLEHNHLRMVDPRWPDELIPGRRVADRCPESEAPGPEETQARFVFCSRVPKPEVSYAYAVQSDESSLIDPRDAVLACRLSSLFKVHLARHPTAGVKLAASASTSTTAAPSANRTPDSHSKESTSGSDQKSTMQSFTNQASASQEPSERGQDNANSLAATTDVTPTGTKDTIKPGGDATTGANSLPPTTATIEQPNRLPLEKPYRDAPVTTIIESQAQQVDPEIPELLQKMLHQANEAAQVICDKSALKPDAALSVPLTTVVCKFFWNGGCARGSGCYFLHPADPELESKVDVRHVVPLHPKFF